MNNAPHPVYTFNEAIKLKQELGNKYSYSFILEQKIKDALKSDLYISFSDLLRKTNGAFPTDLFSSLSKLDKQKIDFSNHEQKTASSFYEKCEIFNKMPPPHLANYDWRYSRKTAQKIINQIEKNKSICCLGTPTIAIELILNGYSNVTLLDINEPIVKIIEKEFLDTKIKCQTYNALFEIPDSLQSHFDIVIIDPPWYLDYYELFILRSLQLIKEKDSFVILPVFPILSHKSACYDVIGLYSFLLQTGAKSIKSCGFVEYEMPEFEKLVIMGKKAPMPDSNWRCAELIQIEFSNKLRVLKKISVPVINDFISWDRKYNEKDKNYYVANTFPLFPLKNKYVFYREQMLSISRKSIMHKKIVVWDSKNRIIIAK